MVNQEAQIDPSGEGNLHKRIELTHENEPVHIDELAMINEPVNMDEQINTDDPTHDDNPPSPASTSSPLQDVENVDQIVIDMEMTMIEEKHNTPEASNLLAKFLAKDEPYKSEKGKVKLQL